MPPPPTSSRPESSDTVWLRPRSLSAAKSRWRPTLRLLFAATVGALLLGLAVLFLLLLEGSRHAITQNAAMLREQASRDIAGRVSGHLATAEDVLRDLQSQFGAGLLSPADPVGIEAALFARLQHQPLLSELTFTTGRAKGRSPDGALDLAEQGRWKLSVFRESGSATSETLAARLVERTGSDGPFVAQRKTLAERYPLKSPWLREDAVATDPTAHATFQTPALEQFHGEALWSDLHWTELDSALPPEARRVSISVQQALDDAEGRFAGVLRVGLLAGRLRQLTELRMAPPGETDPHRVFLCDRQGRLLTPVSPESGYREDVDDLRAATQGLPAEVQAALHVPELAQLDGAVHGRFALAGETYLVSFRALEKSQDWVVGIVVPERAYLEDLLRARNRLLVSAGLLMLLIVAGGLVTLHGVRRDLALALEQTGRIANFELEPSPPSARIADVHTILEGLERSKTALRGIRKYVPTDLVRLLHDAQAEPVLGSEQRELTLMFTDLKDFTTVAEHLPPNQLARALGAYLQTMTREVHAVQGTVDKYIGDAVMAFWNAPLPDSAHALHACEAALRCVEATQKLYASPEWHGLPALVTRIGLHSAEVLVGHFGAPERLNYTAVGDGVNTAARLEGLNKEYGTTLLAGESVYRAAQGAYRFRLLDAVAVKGRQQSLNVYELLGRAGEVDPRAAIFDTYAAALALYRHRDFDTAIQLLRTQTDDPPSRVLARRCEQFLQERPAVDWDGVFVARSK